MVQVKTRKFVIPNGNTIYFLPRLLYNIYTWYSQLYNIYSKKTARMRRGFIHE